MCWRLLSGVCSREAFTYMVNNKKQKGVMAAGGQAKPVFAPAGKK